MKQLSVVDNATTWFCPDAMYYAKNLLAKNEKLYLISPKDFLQLALHFKNPKGSKEKLSGVKNLVEKNIKFNQIPYLRIRNHIEVDSELNKKISKTIGRVYSHEGRHRNFTLKELGYKKVPVILKFQDMERIPEYLVNQNGNKKLKFSDVLTPYK